jgi:hypothetical protein
VDTTGLIFVALIVAWLIYLVPRHLARRTPAAPPEPALPAVTELTVTLHRGAPAETAESDDPDQDEAPAPTVAEWLDSLFELPVSTELTRRAQRHALARLARRAASARRHSLMAGLAAQTAALALWLVGLTTWVTPVAAVGVLLVGLGLLRWSTVRGRRKLEALARAIDQGQDEATVDIYIETPLSAEAEREDSVDLSQAIAQPQLSLWDPLPVPAATYVSRPLAPRTIRTIDLAAPPDVAQPPVVTAEAETGPADEITEAV